MAHLRKGGHRVGVRASFLQVQEALPGGGKHLLLPACGQKDPVSLAMVALRLSVISYGGVSKRSRVTSKAL